SYQDPPFCASTVTLTGATGCYRQWSGSVTLGCAPTVVSVNVTYFYQTGFGLTNVTVGSTIFGPAAFPVDPCTIAYPGLPSNNILLGPAPWPRGFCGCDSLPLLGAGVALDALGYIASSVPAGTESLMPTVLHMTATPLVNCAGMNFSMPLNLTNALNERQNP